MRCDAIPESCKHCIRTINLNNNQLEKSLYELAGKFDDRSEDEKKLQAELANLEMELKASNNKFDDIDHNDKLRESARKKKLEDTKRKSAESKLKSKMFISAKTVHTKKMSFSKPADDLKSSTSFNAARADFEDPEIDSLLADL